jgi:hypothetical protein
MMRLFAPKEFWIADDTHRNSIVGGCGPGGLGDLLVPDAIWWLSIKLACMIHDWMYAFGESLEDKKRADRVFLNNMVRMINSESKYEFLRRLRLRTASGYYEAVKRYGGPAFWDDKKDPNGGEVKEVEI